MEVVYTRHAKARMKWRGITRKEVASVLEDPDHHELIDVSRFHYFKKLGRRDLQVTCVREEEKYIIITVIDKSD